MDSICSEGNILQDSQQRSLNVAPPQRGIQDKKNAPISGDKSSRGSKSD
ncbi:MAG: hypothetical protein AB4040_11895 [Synechococcus sp.]